MIFIAVHSLACVEFDFWRILEEFKRKTLREEKNWMGGSPTGRQKSNFHLTRHQLRRL